MERCAAISCFFCRTLKIATLGAYLLSAAGAGYAQQTGLISKLEVPLPDAPPVHSPAVDPVADGAQGRTPQAMGSISGAVLDSNGGIVPGAVVVLGGRTAGPETKDISGDDGRFTFTGLAAGTYHLTITAPGLQAFRSAEITITAGQRYELPRIALPVSVATADVTVTVTQVELAQEQISAEEKQRVLGVLPNFYSTYIWDAAPLTARQKFGLAFRSVFDPFDFVATGAIAGGQQALGVFKGYGQGAQGYAKRYGANFTDGATGRIIGSAVLPSLLHQDPRYFYRGSGSIRSRILYAVSMAVISKGDNGRWQPNYSHVGGSLASGAISNLYHPANDRGAKLTIDNALIDTAGNAADNLVREFLLRRFTPSVPGFENGKPAETPGH